LPVCGICVWYEDYNGYLGITIGLVYERHAITRNNCGESKTLEFKSNLPEKSEKYIKTLIAFANTSGGKLIVISPELLCAGCALR
jgi:hypothetical protein